MLPSWLRQRVEAISRTVKNRLGPEWHRARTSEGSWGPGVPEDLRVQRHDLAQLADRCPGQAVVDRLLHRMAALEEKPNSVRWVRLRDVGGRALST